MSKVSYTVLSLYKFFKIKNIFCVKNSFQNIFKKLDVKGIILIASEGININISLLSQHKKLVLQELKKIINFENSEVKIANSNKHAFRKFKLKIKKEILTTRNSAQTNPLAASGKYVNPVDWDNLISDSNTVLIDMRNNYEVKVGSFFNAINPKCNNFSELLNWLKEKFEKKKYAKNKKIAMFCTGGIRCEKASAYLLNIGEKNVYHLKGGILKYLENKKKSTSWRGECFVFDDRVSLDSKLKIGSYSICYACRMPISEKDKTKKEYLEGVSCHLCYTKKSEKQRDKYRMRYRQIKLLKKKKN